MKKYIVELIELYDELLDMTIKKQLTTQDLEISIEFMSIRAEAAILLSFIKTNSIEIKLLLETDTDVERMDSLKLSMAARTYPKIASSVERIKGLMPKKGVAIYISNIEAVLVDIKDVLRHL